MDTFILFPDYSTTPEFSTDACYNNFLIQEEFIDTNPHYKLEGNILKNQVLEKDNYPLEIEIPKEQIMNNKIFVIGTFNFIRQDLISEYKERARKDMEFYTKSIIKQVNSLVDMAFKLVYFEKENELSLKKCSRNERIIEFIENETKGMSHIVFLKNCQLIDDKIRIELLGNDIFNTFIEGKWYDMVSIIHIPIGRLTLNENKKYIMLIPLIQYDTIKGNIYLRNKKPIKPIIKKREHIRTTKKSNDCIIS